MRWLATCVALSRVRALSCFRSVGLSNAIREIIEADPPDTLPQQFAKLFAEKEEETARRIMMCASSMCEFHVCSMYEFFVSSMCEFYVRVLRASSMYEFYL